MVSEDKLLTPKAAAEILSVSENTIRAWLRVGVLKGVKPGRRIWRVRQRDLEDFINASEPPEKGDQ